MDKRNISHAVETDSVSQALKILKNQIVERGDLPHVSVSQQLKIAEDLAQFPFGQYILVRKGANAYWTDVLMTHPHLYYTESISIERL